MKLGKYFSSFTWKLGSGFSLNESAFLIVRLYETMGPLGKGGGSHVTVILSLSTATGSKFDGGLVGTPWARVVMFDVSSDVRGSAPRAKETANRN